MLLREEVAQLQEEVQLLRQMKELLSRDLEESSRGGGGGSADLLSAAELRVQLDQKEEELDRAKEALQGRGGDGPVHHAHPPPSPGDRPPTGDSVVFIDIDIFRLLNDE